LNALRGLVAAALVLTAFIVSASAYVRLAQAGLGCADWPACYGRQQEVMNAAAGDSQLDAARTVRRFAASGAGILIVLIAVFGWDRWRADPRRALSLAAVVVAFALAWIGRYTPSPIPAVAIGNLLGGMLLLGLLFTLWREPAAPMRTAAVPVGLTWASLVFVGLQIALGGLMGERYAALACAGLPDCGRTLWPGGAPWGAFDVFRTNEGVDEASRQAVHMAHRFWALATALLVAWTGWCHARMAGALHGHGVALLVLIVVQLALGIAIIAAGLPLALVLAHNFVAALILTVLLDAAVRLHREASP
jgi:cytochrome c oxidase assembly protein subunit 15